MRIIPTAIHGVMDYLMGALLIAAPWIFGFNPHAIEGMVPIYLGIGAIAYSLMTNYEAGAVKVIPMKVHLLLDIVSGVLLAASPWLFGFAGVVYLPHLIFGLLEIGAGLMTDSVPFRNDKQLAREI
ncbi:MAG: hypothetical protein ACAI35_08245 [Candidatus Methylacidiphilales bacterium]|nr:hypothetical protein [Candidatus Methylacidiphilales bacterium]